MSSRPKRKRPVNYMKQADRLFSLKVRSRDGGCVAAGEIFDCKGVLQCAHIISRGYKAIRVDLENAVTLCQSHHLYWTHRQLEWELWVEAKFPGRYARLRERALTYERVDWKAKVAELRA